MVNTHGDFVGYTAGRTQREPDFTHGHVPDECLDGLWYPVLSRDLELRAAQRQLADEQRQLLVCARESLLRRPVVVLQLQEERLQRPQRPPVSCRQPRQQLRL